MEAFSLLKYWRGGGAVFKSDGPTNLRAADSSSSSSTATTTIVTAVSPFSSDSDSDGGDDGPFFDLEFTLPEEDDDSDSEEQMKDHKDLVPNVDEQVENVSEKVKSDGGGVENDEEEEEEEEEGEEIKFTLSSSSSGDSNDPNVSLSPSDDLFFKGRLVPIDSSSMILNAAEALPKFHPVSSILKSATKFRVQMLNFNKSKSNSRENHKKSEPQEKPENQERKQQTSKLFTVKLKVEEVPLVSLFTRDNSSKGTNSKSIKRSNDVVVENSTDSNGPTDERKFSKDVMQKYLKKVKPLYVRVSKRYGDKLRFSGQLSFPKPGAGPPPTAAEVESPTEKPTAMKGNGGGEGGEVACEAAGGSNVVKSTQKQGNLQAGLRVVCKHLGKSRSASSAVVTAPAAPVASNRRDDSLLQQQDGIQSAILHCKRSFNASRDLEASILSRSVSDPSHEKSVS
ncbi:probable membrane-associated kinase regulator 2 [Coffea arabica]|uniref:Probable membrane-associated kinase regulator 2 n=1 Tax=Coffea arabica TaxID=13443 RepID=A0ABM4VG21_COFAR